MNRFVIVNVTQLEECEYFLFSGVYKNTMYKTHKDALKGLQEALNEQENKVRDYEINVEYAENDDVEVTNVIRGDFGNVCNTTFDKDETITFMIVEVKDKE